MQILLLGRIAYEEGLPLEAQQHIVEAVRQSDTKVNYLVGNLLDYLPKQKYDFISLSDTISYLAEEDANQILHKLHPATEKGTCVVIRSFMRAPTAVDVKGWKELTTKNTWAQNIDGTGVYQFHIFEKK